MKIVHLPISFRAIVIVRVRVRVRVIVCGVGMWCRYLVCDGCDGWV